jgi:hypothetical protein
MMPDRPYQSRLLTFLSRQTQRVKDQTGLFWRTVKVATLWGLQIALYPIYALVQASRWVGRQMGQAARQAIAQLTGQDTSIGDHSRPLAIDQPITNLLTAIWQAQAIHNPGLPAAPKLSDRRSAVLALTQLDLKGQDPRSVIQGIASLLGSHRLVLVTADNQPWDILTADQQRYLHQRIIFEMALYWRHWRSRKLSGPSVQAGDRGLASGGGGLVRFQSALTTPLHLFWQLIIWLQNGTVARRINWFGETDRWGEPAAIGTSSVEPRLIAALRGGEPFSLNRALGMNLDSAFWLGLPRLHEISDLIQAAIRYFFGDRGIHRISHTRTEILPGQTPGTIADLPAGMDFPQAIGQSFTQWIRSFLARGTTAIVPPRLAPDLTHPDSGSTLADVAWQRMDSSSLAIAVVDWIVQPEGLNTAVAKGSTGDRWGQSAGWEAEYLEAEVTEMGYEQSWFEQFLQGCDRVLLWLEQAAIGLWQRVQKWLRR